MGGCSRICRKIHFEVYSGFLPKRRKGAKKTAKNAGWSPAGFAPLRLCRRNSLRFGFYWNKLGSPMSASPHPVAQRLTPKLYLQPARQTLVDRPVLLEQLKEGLRGKLTLVSAPAGLW